MSTIVLKSYYADPTTPDATGAYISISGRPPGLVGWILSIMNIDPVTTFRVESKSVVLSGSSCAGGGSHVVPLPKVSSVSSGFHFPLVAAAGLFFGSALLASVVLRNVLDYDFRAFAIPAGILLGLALAIIYCFTNRSLALGVTEVGGRALLIRFKPSIIEGQRIDSKRADEVRVLLQQLVERVN